MAESRLLTDNFTPEEHFYDIRINGEYNTHTDYLTYEEMTKYLLSCFTAFEGSEYAQYIMFVRKSPSAPKDSHAYIICDRPNAKIEVRKFYRSDAPALPLIDDGDFSACPCCERQMNTEELFETEIEYCPFCGQQFIIDEISGSYVYTEE